MTSQAPASLRAWGEPVTEEAVTRIFGLIPAAGKSVRMGQPKLALPLGDRTIIERVVAILGSAGIIDVLVVLGPHVASLAKLATKAGAQVLQLAQETPDMRATIEQGLQWLEEHHRPAAADAFLLLPADHPALDATVIRQLLQARDQYPQASIFMPTYEGKRGHPVLIGWEHVARLRAWPRDQGLNTYLRQQEAVTCEVPTSAPEILRDLDTPADYERLLKEMGIS